MNHNNYHLSRKLLLKFLSDPGYLESMNSLLSQVNASVSADEVRLPDPPNNTTEGDFTSLPEFVSPFLSNDKNSSWWKNALKNYSTYCWDFVSTCTINGRKGLLLVEAKAKRGELISTPNLKALDPNLEDNYRLASSDLRKIAPRIKLSSVTCRQMSNHIYRSWFLARSGIPVILLYVGFYFGKGNRVFNSDLDWKNYFFHAARKIGANKLVNKDVYCGDSYFKLLCASLDTGIQNAPLNGYQKYLKLAAKARKKYVKKDLITICTERLKQTKQERAAIVKSLSGKRVVINKRFSKKSFDPLEVLKTFNENLSAFEYGAKFPSPFQGEG